MSGDDIKQTVREKYGAAALRVLAGEGSSCGCGAITASLYDNHALLVSILLVCDLILNLLPTLLALGDAESAHCGLCTTESDDEVDS